MALAIAIGINLIVWRNFGPLQQVLQSDYAFTTKALLLLSNFFIFGGDSTFFLKLTNSGGLAGTSDFHAANSTLFNYLTIGPAWTLAFELMFYILAPFFIRSKWKDLREKR